MSNVYAPPGTDFSAIENGTASDTRFFSLNGRIGRVRWLGYLSAVWMLNALLAGAVSAAFANDYRGHYWIARVNVLVLVIGYIIMCRRRLHDLGTTPFLMILTIIPVINLYFFFMMIFKRGDDFANEYGPRPRPNDRAAHLLACIVPLTMIAGIVAAIAIPAYQEYSNRAEARQQVEQAP